MAFHPRAAYLGCYRRPGRREVTVQVRDNRIGISHEDLPHVFEPYFRGRNIGRSDGPGLGSEFVAEDDATV
jgi:signal transduction histidine kinase